MFEVAPTPLHTLAIPNLLDELLQLFHSILELGGKGKGCGSLLLLKMVVRTVVLHGDVFEATFYICNNILFIHAILE